MQKSSLMKLNPGAKKGGAAALHSITPSVMREKKREIKILMRNWDKNGVSQAISNGEIEVAQSCPTLCNSMDCSLSGSSVHGIFQARMLEWIAISFSRGSSRPRNRICVS